MEIPGLEETIPNSQIFKHLGHNPWSGDLHYQCPGCRIVLLVKPMDVLDEVWTPRRHFPQRREAIPDIDMPVHYEVKLYDNDCRGEIEARFKQ